jgi:hypothetical protein
VWKVSVVDPDWENVEFLSVGRKTLEWKIIQSLATLTAFSISINKALVKKKERLEEGKLMKKNYSDLNFQIELKSITKHGDELNSRAIFLFAIE